MSRSTDHETQSALNTVVAELSRELTADGHELERIPPELWTALNSTRSESSDVACVFRCKPCGRAFLLIRLNEDAFFVADEDGDEIEIAVERPCAARVRSIQ